MIKAYYADTRALEEDPALFDKLYKRVPPGRRRMADRLAQKADRCMSVGAGALLDMALQREGIDAYEIDRGPAGAGAKPVLCIPGAQLCFNLSHSHGAVFCALADFSVGCDVERVREDVNLKLADRFFSVEERARLAACEDEEARRELFFRYWTLKESFVKATGLGLRFPLDAFSILLPPEGAKQPIGIRQKRDRSSYAFREIDPGDGCRYALCGAGDVAAQLEGAIVEQVIF